MGTAEIGFETVGDVAVLRVRGDVTAASEGAFSDAYELADAAGAGSIVIDFSALDYMNSGGIGLLVTLLVRARRADRQVLATGLDDHYRQILSLTRLDEAIQIHDTEAAALAAAA